MGVRGGLRFGPTVGQGNPNGYVLVGSVDTYRV